MKSSERSYVLLTMILLSFGDICAQENKQLVRLAKLVIEPSQLDNYMAILKEEIEGHLLSLSLTY